MAGPASTLEQIDRVVKNFQVEDYYEPQDMVVVLSIINTLIEEVRRLDAAVQLLSASLKKPKPP